LPFPATVTGMSDFDAVLERLVTDQAFAAALAADPAAALAGYRLDADEIELLHSQVGGESGGQHAVEVRTNQSSLFGMLSPLVGMAGALPSIADNLPGGGTPVAGSGGGFPADVGSGGPAPHQGFGPAQVQAGFGTAPGADGDGGFGAAGTEGFGSPAGQGGFGPAESVPGQGAFGPAQGMPGQGPAQGAGLFPGGLQQGGGFGGFSEQVGDALSQDGPHAEAHGGADYAVPEGYHAGLDLDGDGRDDEHILRGRADGGVDILVDRDGDGQVDIIGHDDDADGHVESADYDKDGDGHFERTRYDDDHDGWLDRTVVNEEGGTKADSTVDFASIAKHLRMS
jgi:hypothetical protein